MGYGLGPASNAAFDGGGERRAISILGDGGFWHNGLSSSIGNMVFNKSDSVAVIVDNYYSAATGGQDVLSSRAENATKNTGNPISAALKGVGVEWIRQIDHTYDVAKVRAVLREALTTDFKGPKVIVASSECMLNKQRREKPIRTAAIKEGRRVDVPRFGVDPDVCTGDHACIRLSGCPSLSLKRLDDPLRDDPVAHIDQTCVGCGNCGEVADAADRLHMLNLALGDVSGLKLSDVELKRSGPSYTIDTVKHFKHTLPIQSRIYLIMGMDAFLEIDTWKSYDELLLQIPFIIINRPKPGSADKDNGWEFMEKFLASKISTDYVYSESQNCYRAKNKQPVYVFEVTSLDISSTRIRNLISTGRSIDYFVPQKVAEFINSKGLYL